MSNIHEKCENYNGKKDLIKMTEYEEFKKWMREYMENLPFIYCCGVDVEYLFRRFEEEQEEKRKEKEIKDTIEQALEENNCCFAGRDTYANAIYKKLEEKDLIK